MNRNFVKTVTFLYPKAWRERYAEELADLCEECLGCEEMDRLHLGTSLIASGLLQRLRAFCGAVQRANVRRTGLVGAALGGAVTALALFGSSTFGPVGQAGASALCPTSEGHFCYTPQVFRNAYGITPLLQQGIEGKGSTIGIINGAVVGGAQGATDLSKDLYAYDARSAVRHALAVGEVVLPSANEGQVARPLVVALARAGVTSTTSVASGPRYGALEVDSNVPDFRIAIGGPAENTFVAKLLAGLDRGAARECNEMLDNGHAPVWVPASVGSRKLLGPSADVRGDRDLPVLIVPARDGFAAACARLVEDLDDAEICGLRLGQIKDTAVEAEDFTVAVINKGTPGFAVDPDGRFYLSLMRSCTGWPSGVWVDEPARPTPDGSGYHLSHWDHRFEYSIVAGQGDWRAMRLPARASELNRPPVAREATPGSGPLPPAHSFYSLSPAREVLMSALKLRGNPHAEGREARVVKDPEVTIRLYAAGTPRTATITEAMGLGQLRVTDALELDPGKPLAGRAVELAAWRAITVNAPLPIRQLSTTALMEGPAHARYWMHNSGAAPAGFVPVALHLEPREMDLGVEPATVRLSISSDRTDAAVQRHVSLVLPEGWSGDAECFPVELAPGQSWSRELKVQASSGAPPGIYFLKAIMRDELGRELQDTTRIGLGTLTSADRDLLVEVMEKELRIPRNGHRSLHVKLTNQTRSAIDCRLDAIAPLDAWSLLPSPTVLVTVAPMSHTEVHVPVVAGPAFPGGKWWALVKAMWFAQRSYSEALVLEV